MPPHDAFMQHIPILSFRRGVIDASAAAPGYKAPASVMDGRIRLIQPAQSHFYSPVFEKRTDGSTSPRRALDKRPPSGM